MKKIILVLLLMATKFTFAQIINGGFEIWDTTYTATYAPELISMFSVPNPQSGVINHWVSSSTFGATRTTDSYAGNYALILHNWYNYATEWITYHQPLTIRPAYLQGNFKYITGGVNGLSHGLANVTLTHFNGTSNDTIAKGSFEFDSTVSYTPFQIPLNYLSSLTPDSITIYIINSKVYTSTGVVCHLLYLDNLSFSNTFVEVKNVESSEMQVNIYPNPVAQKLIIENNSTNEIHFTLYNMLGEKTTERLLNNITSTIDLTGFDSGIYFYKITSGAEINKTGKIVKQ